MKRRTLLRWTAAALASAAAGIAYFTPRGPSRHTRTALMATARDHLEAAFPTSVTTQAATQTFLDRYVEFAQLGSAHYAPDMAVHHFVVSSNVIRHVETGEPLDFTDLFHPYLTPCTNQLGALYAPDGEHDI